MTEPPSQQWCGFRGPELCSGDPLRMGGHCTAPAAHTAPAVHMSTPASRHCSAEGGTLTTSDVTTTNESTVHETDVTPISALSL